MRFGGPGQRLLHVLQPELRDLGCTFESTRFLYPRPARRKRWLLLGFFLCGCLILPWILAGRRGCTMLHIFLQLGSHVQWPCTVFCLVCLQAPCRDFAWCLRRSRWRSAILRAQSPVGLHLKGFQIMAMISGRQDTSRYVTFRHDVPSQAASNFSSIQQLPSAAQVRCGGYWFWSCQRVSSKRCQFASACSENSCKMLQGCFLEFPLFSCMPHAKHCKTNSCFRPCFFCSCFTMLHDHNWGSTPARLEECSSDAEIWDDLEPYGTFHSPSRFPVFTFRMELAALSLRQMRYVCISLIFFAYVGRHWHSMWNVKLLQTKSGIVPTHLRFIVHLDSYLDEGMHGDVVEAQGNWRDFLPAPASADCAGVYDCLGRRVLSWASRRILGTGPGDGIGPTLSPASWWQALLGPQLPIIAMCDYKV